MIELDKTGKSTSKSGLLSSENYQLFTQTRRRRQKKTQTIEKVLKQLLTYLKPENNMYVGLQ